MRICNGQWSIKLGRMMCHVIALQSLKSSRFIKMLSSLSRSLGRIFVSRCLAALAVTLDASPMGHLAVYWLYSVRMRRQWELAVWNFSATYYNIELMHHINSALTTVCVAIAASRSWYTPRLKSSESGASDQWRLHYYGIRWYTLRRMQPGVTASHKLNNLAMRKNLLLWRILI